MTIGKCVTLLMPTPEEFEFDSPKRVYIRNLECGIVFGETPEKAKEKVASGEWVYLDSPPEKEI